MCVQPDQDDGVTSKFILGSAGGNNPNFMYFKFQNPDNLEWYYWYIKGQEVSIRPADDSMITMDLTVFRTVSTDC